MGSFNDLPKDVVWMIFKRVINMYLKQHYRGVLVDDSFIFSFSTHDYGWLMKTQMQTLSLTSRPALTIIRTKCKKFADNRSWHFKTGALF